MNSDTDRMMQIIFGYWVTQSVHAAATFSVADHLAKGAKTEEEIAKAEGTDASATFRLLRTCASLGMAAYDGKSRFVATPLLHTLRKDNPKNLRGLALSLPAPGHWLPWGHFTEAVKTGQCQTVRMLGAGLFEYLAANPAEGSAFAEAMTSFTSTARVIDTSGVNIVADIGGSRGAMLHALWCVNPHLQGIVFDRLNVIASARAADGKSGLKQ